MLFFIFSLTRFGFNPLYNWTQRIPNSSSPAGENCIFFLSWFEYLARLFVPPREGFRVPALAGARPLLSPLEIDLSDGGAFLSISRTPIRETTVRA